MVRVISLSALLIACKNSEAEKKENTVVIQDTATDSGENDPEDTGGDDETGIDTAEDTEEPPLTGCQADLTEVEPTAVAGQFELGDFIVQLSGAAQLNVVSQKNTEQSVFAARGEGWLHLGHTELEAEEHQGSFDVNTQTSYTCSVPVFDSVQYAHDALNIQGTFTNCDEQTFELFICEASEDRISFRFQQPNEEINYLALHVQSDAEEGIYGLGEQFPHDSLNLNGREIPILSQEGGVGRGHGIITPAVNLFSEGSGGSEASTYYAAPHYLTSNLGSIFLKNYGYSEFDFKADDEIAIRVYEGQLEWEALYGESPLMLISRFTEYAGRMPEPPLWVDNGAIIALARPLEESAQIISELKDAGAEIAAVWNQTWSGINETFIGEQVLWNWEQNEVSHPDWDSWVSELNNQDIEVLCYINSMFVDVTGHETMPDRNLYQEGIDGDYFVQNIAGGTLLLPVTAFDVALLDLTNPEAREWMKQIIIQEMLQDAGCKGWMVDFAEALPFDARLSDGTSAALYHNQYPVEWMKLNREAIEEAGLLGDVLTFNRAGFTRSPSYSLLFWEGDQLTTWDKYDGMKSALHGLLNGGFSGLALNHSDTGGYTSLSRFGLGYSREDQLMMRWAEMNAFTAILRTHEGNQPEQNAQVYTDQEQIEQFTRMSKIYKALAFYRRTLFQEASSLGYPVVRHLWLHYPDDQEAREQDKQFLLGSELLVAPVLEKCVFDWSCNPIQQVYLPDDSWIHLWTGEEFEGEQSITVEAPIGYPPVFYKKDSPIAEDLLVNLRSAGIDVHN